MKTKHTHLIKLLFISALLSLLTLAGCNDKSEESSNNEEATNLGVEVNKPNPPKIDIHSAVISDDIDAIKQHILTGSDLDQKDPFGGSSPLITAALFDKKEIVIILIEAGADLNFKNNDGSTALHTAAFFCRPEIVKILLDNGINKTIKNNTGSTAYDAVTGAFETVKPIYDVLGQSLAPMGLKLDYAYLKATRPQIADMLK